MRRLVLAIILIGGSSVLHGQTESPKPAYDFGLPREDRIKLAESAAPPEISSKATVYLLERTGYVKVREGTNGFSCIVDRQTPLNQEPTCFDAEGSATTLKTRIFAEEKRAAGKSEESIAVAIQNGYKTNRFHAPRKPGIAYMTGDFAGSQAGFYGEKDHRSITGRVRRRARNVAEHSFQHGRGDNFGLFTGHNEIQSWPRESGQNDKWIFCLTAAKIAAHQERS